MVKVSEKAMDDSSSWSESSEEVVQKRPTTSRARVLKESSSSFSDNSSSLGKRTPPRKKTPEQKKPSPKLRDIKHAAKVEEKQEKIDTRPKQDEIHIDLPVVVPGAQSGGGSILNFFKPVDKPADQVLSLRERLGLE